VPKNLSEVNRSSRPRSFNARKLPITRAEAEAKAARSQVGRRSWKKNDYLKLWFRGYEMLSLAYHYFIAKVGKWSRFGRRRTRDERPTVDRRSTDEADGKLQ
jgi:hypothetical protein